MKAFQALLLTAAITVTLLGVTTHAQAKPTLKNQKIVARKHEVWKARKHAVRKHTKRKYHVRKHVRHQRHIARHHAPHH